MHFRIVSLLSFLFVTFGITETTNADPPFEECTSRTDARAVITIPLTANPTIEENTLPEGAEIAAYTEDGVCAGRVTWSGENTALVVWGNDSVTEEKDGFVSGETISFRIWDPSTEQVYTEDDVFVSFSSDRNFFMSERSFQEGGIYVLSGLNVGSGPGVTQIDYVYPNPTTDQARVRVSLRDSEDVRIRVYDVLGRLVATLVDEQLPGGEYTVLWDTANGGGLPVSSGMYFIRMEYGSDAMTEAVTVVR